MFIIASMLQVIFKGKTAQSCSLDVVMMHKQKLFFPHSGNMEIDTSFYSPLTRHWVTTKGTRS